MLLTASMGRAGRTAARPRLVGQVPRARLSLGRELVLASLPMAAIVGVFVLADALSGQRLLFTSLASSAFLIYMEPHHGANEARTLVLAQTMAVLSGYACYAAFGPGYLSGGVAMAATVLVMIAARVMHPPAVATSLSFAFRSGSVSNVVIFTLALGLTAVLVGLQRGLQWTLRHLSADSI